MENIEKIFWDKTPYWWIVLIPGILFIPCGCWFLFSPSVGYFTITTILLWMLILSGIAQLIIAFNTTRNAQGWGWWIAGGIIDIFVGFMMLSNIGFSAMILPYFFAFVFLYKGVSNLVSATRGPQGRNTSPTTGPFFPGAWTSSTRKKVGSPNLLRPPVTAIMPG